MRTLTDYLDYQNQIVTNYDNWEAMLDYIQSQYGLSANAIHELMRESSYERQGIKISIA
jgi:hypothetical protein